eukprot:GEMP01002124.1.p1 GENE.GEMP01002124.1~~GEMP01002124.1.p1  ORF type:complete len:538 (+),score=62.12 GEMP01002124.1:74-1687(+)
MDRRKIPRRSPLLSYYRPALAFRQIPIEDVDWGPTDLEDGPQRHFSMHVDSASHLYVSNQSRILRFSPNGSYKVLCEDLEQHHIIPNCITDSDVVILKKDKTKLLRVNGKTGETEVIVERQPNAPLCGPDVYLDDSDSLSVVHHPVPQKLELLTSERSKFRGQVRAAVEGGRGKIVSFDANSYLTAGPDGYVYFSSRTCVYRWDPDEKVVESVAGHPKCAGQRDGYGADARFTHLKRPVLTMHHAYVRENDNRFCRIDLKTFEVRTLELRGVDFRAITTYGVMREGQRMFVLCGDPFRLYGAPTWDVTASTFSKDMMSINWCRSIDEAVDTSRNPVDLKTDDNVILRADGRVLMARSPYFRQLLSPESNFREAKLCSNHEPITLRGVCSRALRSVLYYLHTDSFEPVPLQDLEQISDEKIIEWATFALEVQRLADRFLLPRLQKLCEMFIVATVRPATVLYLWCAIHDNNMTGKGLVLEKAIARFVEDHWVTIRDNHPNTLRMVVERQGALAVQLLMFAQRLRCSVQSDFEDTEVCA